MKLIPFAAASLLACAATLAQALEVQPYSAAALEAARKSDQPFALHFRADWCPTCRAQDKILESLKADKDLDLKVLAVNYDTEKDLKKAFNIRSQSTLVVLHGSSERARSIGDTTAAGLRATLKRAF